MEKLINYLTLKKKKLKKKYIPLHEPNISNLDKQEIIKSLKTGFVSTAGNDIIKFEKILKKVTKSKFLALHESQMFHLL